MSLGADFVWARPGRCVVLFLGIYVFGFMYLLVCCPGLVVPQVHAAVRSLYEHNVLSSEFFTDSERGFWYGLSFDGRRSIVQKLVNFFVSFWQPSTVISVFGNRDYL